MATRLIRFQSTSFSPIRVFICPSCPILREFERNWNAISGCSAISARRSLCRSVPDAAGEILALYTRDFISAWEQALGNLKFKSMRNDKPLYTTLQAVSAPTSPVVQLLESIRGETLLTQDLSAEASPGPVAAELPRRPGPKPHKRSFSVMCSTARAASSGSGLRPGSRHLLPAAFPARSRQRPVAVVPPLFRQGH